MRGDNDHRLFECVVPINSSGVDLCTYHIFRMCFVSVLLLSWYAFSLLKNVPRRNVGDPAKRRVLVDPRFSKDEARKVLVKFIGLQVPTFRRSLQYISLFGSRDLSLPTGLERNASWPLTTSGICRTATKSGRAGSRATSIPSTSRLTLRRVFYNDPPCHIPG